MATGLAALKTTLNNEGLQKKFQEMMGKKSVGFLTSLTTCVQNNSLLQKADINGIILAAGQAAALDLPINPNLGLAAIIPFKGSAQFQIMRDGWMDLCLRTGQFRYIANEVVYEGELVTKNRFTGEYSFDETKKTSEKIVGFMASFELTNGYRKTIYSTVEEIKKHGMKYSQTYKMGKGLWVDNFEAMGLKTVLKHLLKKYAPKSIETIAMAVESDQATFSGDLDNLGNAQASYPDNDNTVEAEVVDFVEVDTETGEVTE